MLNNKRILITGGTGSFGKHFLKQVLKKYNKIKRMVIFSRDEFKQYEMRENFKEKKYPFMRYFLGDVRDRERVNTAFKDIDIVIHAAAYKQVPAAEYNPFEFIKTNVVGAQNVVDAAINNKVEKVIALSTDKAVSPINLYGATKLCSEKLFVSANNIKGSQKTSFSVVRYGNVMNSRGSVIPHFLNLKKQKKILNLTHPKMTRFHITLDQSVNLVLWLIKNSVGGEILIPKIPSLRIIDIIKSLKSNYNISGIRAGEKIHEDLVSTSDSLNTVSLKNYYLILPAGKKRIIEIYKKKHNAKKVREGFSYNSFNNEHYLSVEEIKSLIKKLNISEDI